MTIHPVTFWMIQTVVVIAVLAAVTGIIFYFSTLTVDTSDYEYKAQITRLQASAKVHLGRYESFEYVCSEIGVPDEITCHDNAEGYALEISLSDGTYLCADSTGFEGIHNYSKGKAAVCN